jgi:hypothetical protein
MLSSGRWSPGAASPPGARASAPAPGSRAASEPRAPGWESVRARVAECEACVRRDASLMKRPRTSRGVTIAPGWGSSPEPASAYREPRARHSSTGLPPAPGFREPVSAYPGPRSRPRRRHREVARPAPTLGVKPESFVGRRVSIEVRHSIHAVPFSNAAASEPMPARWVRDGCPALRDERQNPPLRRCTPRHGRAMRGLGFAGLERHDGHRED